MAGKINNFQQSDVAFWGMGAIVFGAIAVLSTSISAVLPQNVWVGLHANRLEGGNLNQLRAEVTQLRDQQIQMRRQTNQLRGRLVVAERGRGDVSQRVGALESTIPMLLEVVPPGAEIDRGTFTASIGVNDGEPISFEAEGGTVTLTQRPMLEEEPADETILQAVPAPLTSSEPNGELQPLGEIAVTPEIGTTLPQELGLDTGNEATLLQTQFGIAIGNAVSLEGADDLWLDLSSKVGTLLLGLEPAVSDPLHDGTNRIVMGPIEDYAQAEMLCLRITRVGIDCLPVQFEGAGLTGL